MEPANDAFSTDPYFFLPEIASYGPSTVPPQLLNDPPIEFDLSWLSLPLVTNPDLLYDTPFANSLPPVDPFETSWFAESTTSKFPPLNGFLHGNSLQPAPVTPPSRSPGPSAVTQIAPKRRVQKGKRRGEEDRIKLMQNDKFIVSFTEARVICAGCQQSIKLDTRNGARYYPGLWVRHRGICKSVAK